MHTIRQYIESDLDDVLSTWENANKLAHPFLKSDFVDQVRKDIPALYLPNADTWVIEDDFDEVSEKKVIGFIALIGNEVGAIFLQPEHHGKKLGKMMMDIAHHKSGAEQGFSRVDAGHRILEIRRQVQRNMRVG